MRVLWAAAFIVALSTTLALAEEPIGCDKFKWPIDKEIAAIALRAVVHPVGVSRKKHIGGGTLLNLLHQSRTGRIAGDDLNPAAACEQGVHFIKCIFHGRRSEDGYRLVFSPIGLYYQRGNCH
jgi:hypothetical protein